MGFLHLHNPLARFVGCELLEKFMFLFTIRSFVHGHGIIDELVRTKVVDVTGNFFCQCTRCWETPLAPLADDARLGGGIGPTGGPV